MKNCKKYLAFLMAVCMLVSLLPMGAAAAETNSAGIIEAKGHLESAYVEWSFVDGADGYNVYVQASGASGWTQLDDMLIREYSSYMRADALGLKAGKYVLKVVPLVGGEEQESAALETKVLDVLAHDRSGYGFASGSTYGTASGAYNNDGTLRSDAQVIYVTAATAKTCTATVNGAVYTGFQTILDAKQKQGTTEPLCFRIVGLVTLSDLDHISSSSEGIQIKGKSNYNQMNITIEGVGEDATVSGFGFLIRNCGNVEMRNLGIMNFMDDGVSVDTNNCNLWIHNCDFFYGDAGSDSDQAKGDGSLDTKKSQYITYSYNHFWDSGKVHLVGNGTDSVNYLTFHHNWYDHSDSRHPRVRCGTVHVYNNFYDGVSKYGIGATMDADVFSEANYFLNTKYPILISQQGSDIYDSLSGAYDGEGTFSGEDGGMIKSYGDVIINATRFVPYSENSTHFDAYVASSRNETVPSGVKAAKGGAGYSNFDTASGFYSYEAETAAEAMATVKQYAGRINQGDFQWTFTDADNTDYEVNSAMKSAITGYKSPVVAIGGMSTNTGANGGGTDATDPTGDSSDPTSGGTTIPAGSYVHNFTENAKVSDFYTINGNLTKDRGTVTYNGLSLTQGLKMESSTTISFTAPSAGTLTLVFGGSDTASSDQFKLNGTSTSINSSFIYTGSIAAGSYTITKDDTCTLYYMVYTSDSVAGGETDPTEESSEPTEKPSDPTEESSEPTEEPTEPSQPAVSADAKIHNFTDDGFTSDFYTFAGNQITNGKHGTYTYDFGHGTETLNNALKFDSGGSVVFTAPANGKLTIAVASEKSGRTVVINDGTSDVGTVSVAAAKTLYTLTVDVTAGTSYTVKRTSGESGLYYIAYEPDVQEPVVEPFSVAGVNLALNNDITLYMYLMAENYDPSYTMEITKSYADGREVTKTVAAADWENYYGTMYRVGFNGIAAKEMTDEITVTVYDASGNAVSKEFVTTVADAAVLVYKSEANAASFTMMADLLNYGAAAQGNFRYNTDDLANTRLTAEQAAYASARFDMSTVTGKASGTAGAMGATLYLDTNIQHNFIFDAAVVDSTMTAKVSYTNYKGVANSFTIPGSRFVNNGSMITVNVSALTPADVNVPVTVQIVDANGAAVCSLTDSIAWYCVRAQASATNDLFIELMEFATSCNAYFG